VTASVVTALLVMTNSSCSSINYSEDFDRQSPVPGSGTWAWKPLTTGQQQSLAAINPFLQRRIERAVERELDDRSFELVSDASPDFLVSAYPILPERSSRAVGAGWNRSPVRVSVGVGVGFGRPYGWGRPYGYRGWGAYGPAVSFWNPYPWWGWGRPYFGYMSVGWSPGFGYGAYSMGGYGRGSVIGSGDRGPGTLVIDVIDTSSGEVVWQGLADGALLDMPSGDQLDAYIDEVVQRTLAGFPPQGRSAT
jgi:hypothetical protein